jgi:hypothetical protein
MKNKAEANDIVAAGLASGTDGGSASIAAPHYVAEFECIGADGLPKWKTRWKNLVTTAGKADLINKYFGCTGGYTALWYMGLASNDMSTVGSKNPNVSDVLTNHAWAEAGGYGASRQAITFASTYAVTTASTSAAYAFTGNQSIGGAFICNVSATTNSTGVLYSDNTFAATRAVSNGDTLNVTVTVSFA